MTEESLPWVAPVDLFAFTPVPTGADLSTKKSRIGTIVFYSVFFAYFVYTFYAFLAINTPRINQFTNPLDESRVYEAPEMAFAFVRGDNLNSIFYNTSYFYFKFEHVTIPQDTNIPREYTDIPLVPCHPSWLNTTFELLCPSEGGQLQGLLYGSPIHKYPRMKVFLCDNATTNNTCETYDNINWVLMTGRLFVFLKQYSTYNYANGRLLMDNTPYVSYYYFLIMDMYNRAEVKVQAENITILPDLFTSLGSQELNTLKIINQNFYVSRVPTNVTHSLFVWWCSMSEDTIITTVGFDTLLDILSNVGAMWGLLVALFTLYYWEYNRKHYYKRHPHMTNFDEKITPFVEATDKIPVEPHPRKSQEVKAKSELLANLVKKMVLEKEIELHKVKTLNNGTQEDIEEGRALRRGSEKSDKSRKSEYDSTVVVRAVRNRDKEDKDL